MNGLMLHCGAKRVTRQDVEAVPVPEATSSWAPVPYARAIDFIHEAIGAELHAPIKSESYGLSKAGDQLFALAVLDLGDAESGLSIGVRQSYNKSLALGVAVGASVFVCDNLCFRGDAFMVVRKNTTNVWRDFQELVRAQVRGALGHHQNMLADVAKLKGTPCGLRRGYAMLGVALGEGVITPTQATVAFGDWTTPRHPEFAGRDMWSLYNCVTEGLKKGSAERVLRRHVDAHAFMTGLCS